MPQNLESWVNIMCIPYQKKKGNETVRDLRKISTWCLVGPFWKQTLSLQTLSYSQWFPSCDAWQCDLAAAWFCFQSGLRVKSWTDLSFRESNWNKRGDMSLFRTDRPEAEIVSQSAAGKFTSPCPFVWSGTCLLDIANLEIIFCGGL